MHRTLTTFLALSLCLAAGCGGGDDGSSDQPAKAPAKTEKTAKPASAPAGDVPTYAQVKAIALKDPKVAKLCADGGEDRKIGMVAEGETYTRLICDGNREVLDYVVGAKGYSENYAASVKLGTYDLWKLGAGAYIAPGLSGPKTLAADVKAECGCGQTVQGGYGR
jgi:hypothetical protein